MESDTMLGNHVESHKGQESLAHHPGQSRNLTSASHSEMIRMVAMSPRFRPDTPSIVTFGGRDTLLLKRSFPRIDVRASAIHPLCCPPSWAVSRRLQGGDQLVHDHART